MDLSILRRTAASIAAAAVYELYPNVEILGGQDTPTGFSYEFYFPHPIHPEMTAIIEERIRQIAREKRPIKTLQMVPFSASELLKKEGHFARIDEMPDEGLVDVIQIGSFYDLNPGPHLKNTAELAAFKLLSIEALPEKRLRLTGFACPSKDELKKYLKKWNEYGEKNHIVRGEKRGFWTTDEKGFVWLNSGLEARKSLIGFLKKNLFQGAAEIETPPGADRLAIQRKLGLMRVGEMETNLRTAEDPALGLFGNGKETMLQISSCPMAPKILNEMISCLQSIGKTLTMLGFNYCIRLACRTRSKMGLLSDALRQLGWEAQIDSQVETSPRIDFLVEDGLGRRWAVAQVREIREKGSRAVGCLASVPVEKNLALLLEICEGFWTFRSETEIKEMVRI